MSAPELTLVETLLRSLEESKQRLLDALTPLTDQEFAWQGPAGGSIKGTLEKAADDLTFFYGWLVTRVRGLRPIPCLRTAEFFSLREAAVGLQVAHRRLVNMLHDLRPEELERHVEGQDQQPLSLARILEMAAQHYQDCTARVEALRQAFREAHL